MNKWLVLGLVAAVVIVGSIFAFQIIYQPKQSEHLESLVPADALYYLYSYNPNKKIADFSNSQFYQKISGLPIYEKHLKPQVDKLKEKTLFLQDIFSGDSAVALFPSDSSFSEKDSFKSGKLEMGKFLMLARLGPESTQKTLKDLRRLLDCSKIC